MCKLATFVLFLTTLGSATTNWFSRFSFTTRTLLLAHIQYLQNRSTSTSLFIAFANDLCYVPYAESTGTVCEEHMNMPKVNYFRLDFVTKMFTQFEISQSMNRVRLEKSG